MLNTCPFYNNISIFFCISYIISIRQILISCIVKLIVTSDLKLFVCFNYHYLNLNKRIGHDLFKSFLNCIFKFNRMVSHRACIPKIRTWRITSGPKHNIKRWTPSTAGTQKYYCNHIQTTRNKLAFSYIVRMESTPTCTMCTLDLREFTTLLS